MGRAPAVASVFVRECEQDNGREEETQYNRKDNGRAVAFAFGQSQTAPHVSEEATETHDDRQPGREQIQICKKQ